MSQSRTRKSSSAENGEVSRSDATTEARVRGVGKAAGDSGAGGKPRSQQPPRPANSRSKVPKAVRDELENALVGLCDVWFEDIKPHLVLNNIKLHGHGGSGGGGGGGPATASGDHAQGSQPRLRCAHADPGAASDNKRAPAASSACYCPTPQAESRAPYRRPPPPHPSRPAHSGTSPSKGPPLNQLPCDSPSPQPAGARQSRRQLQPPPHISWLAPQLCAYSVLEPLDASPGALETALSTPGPSTWDSNPLILDCVRFKHKWTQTMPASQIAGHGSTPSKQKCGRCPATTTFHPHRSRVRDKRRRVKAPTPLAPAEPLVLEDDPNDKNIRVLFRSPSRDEPLSVMNLIVSAKPKSPPHKDNKKLPPWK